MSKIITGHGDFYGYLSEAQVVFQLGGRKQHKHSPSWLLNHIKAAKYYQLVAQHCFVCKFSVDVSRFSPCVINLSRNKYLCCGLKKAVAKSRAQVCFNLSDKFWLCCSFIIKLATCLGSRPEAYQPTTSTRMF